MFPLGSQYHVSCVLSICLGSTFIAFFSSVFISNVETHPIQVSPLPLVMDLAMVATYIKLNV
jgi:hypothetical protein